MSRECIVQGMELGITSINGLIAQGRGEAFDYLIGEITLPSAKKAQYAASALLLLAQRPVISVNGNAAALVPDELIELARQTGAILEVNLFYRTKKRVYNIIKHLEARGAPRVLGGKPDVQIPGLSSKRGWVSSEGIHSADVVFVPLEDGDRCEALVGMGKQIIAVDLNPLSRTARKATISIVDNIIRVMPNIVEMVEELKGRPAEYLQNIVDGFDNWQGLDDAVESIYRNITKRTRIK